MGGGEVSAIGVAGVGGGWQRVEVKELDSGEAGEVGGWWDPQERCIWLEKTEYPGGEAVTRLLLFHEIAHAQLDSWSGGDAEWPESLTECLRRLAVAGEALLLARENRELLRAIVSNRGVRMCAAAEV